MSEYLIHCSDGTELYHVWGIGGWGRGKEKKGHKYIARVQINGKWRYFYSQREFEFWTKHTKQGQQYKKDTRRLENLKQRSEYEIKKIAEEDMKYRESGSKKDERYPIVKKYRTYLKKYNISERGSFGNTFEPSAYKDYRKLENHAARLYNTVVNNKKKQVAMDFVNGYKRSRLPVGDKATNLLKSIAKYKIEELYFNRLKPSKKK